MAEKKEKKKKPVRKLRSLHDEVVKDFLSDNETAKSFFKEYLPAEIVKSLDFNMLHICKDTFLNKKLAKYFSDILYQISLNNIGIFIYLLIDHKSREEGFMGIVSQAKQESRDLAGDNPHCDLSRSQEMGSGYTIYFIF